MHIYEVQLRWLPSVVSRFLQVYDASTVAPTI